MNSSRKLIGVVVVALAGSAMVRAEDPQQVRAEVYRMWDVDSMILQAADNVSRRYNLNPQQTEYTRKMMKERVTRFLEENQEQIWPLVRDLARFQLSGSAPDENTARRIGAAAQPLVEKAKKAIFESNMEWGNILTEEQKRLHEYDLQEMQGTFAKVTENFKQWESGKPTAENPIFPPYVPNANEPPTPAQPAGRYNPVEKKQRNQENSWARTVGEFIRKYNLDPGQREAAHSILRELKTRSAEYREKHKDRYADLDKRFKEAFDSADLKRQAALEGEETALNKPIKDMFNELVARLEKIPTEAQKERYDQSIAGRRPNRRPVDVTTRPVLPVVPAQGAEQPDPQPGQPSPEDTAD